MPVPKGYKWTPAIVKRRRLAQIGKMKSWLKGKKMPEELKKKISDALKGKKPKNLEFANKRLLLWRENHSQSGKNNGFYGKKHSEETKANWRKKRKGQFAKEKHPNWKGGIAPINNIIRGSVEGKLWQKEVLKRDNYKCQKCGEKRIRYLMVHHILNFSSHLELRFVIDNGIVFCRSCHKEFHGKYGRVRNNRQQIEDFLRIERAIEGIDLTRPLDTVS